MASYSSTSKMLGSKFFSGTPKGLNPSITGGIVTRRLLFRFGIKLDFQYKNTKLYEHLFLIYSSNRNLNGEYLSFPHNIGPIPALLKQAGASHQCIRTQLIIFFLKFSYRNFFPFSSCKSDGISRTYIDAGCTRKAIRYHLILF